jgi:hypothetical protein
METINKIQNKKSMKNGISFEFEAFEVKGMFEEIFVFRFETWKPLRKHEIKRR